MDMITLTTDFGDSEYVGALKGIIYSICPDARVVDLTHSIRKFDIRHAAYVLHTVCRYFPKGTVHVVVVDPGVGTKRRGVIVKTEDFVFVGADNGVFSLIYGIEEIFKITVESKSKTFHGRDVFAPIAAKIECGSTPEEFGTLITGIKKIDFGKVKINEDDIEGEVFCIDYFGNVITNIKSEDFSKIGIESRKGVSLEIKNKKYELRFLESYGFAKKGELCCLFGSGGYLEMAVNQGDASKSLDVKGGEKVVIFR
ncbi:MAG: S-adenosyl-l-methionine hydroxide adenosyltransferase family protein [Candidatus Hydrothermarchaeales archaeon]